MHNIQISCNLKVTLTTRQILNIGIFPVIKKTASIIMSCLLDKSIFGYFDISKVFITGSLLKTFEHNETYQWFLVSELEKEIKAQIREKTYRTKLEICIRTSRQYDPISKGKTVKIGRPFCYDIFLKGEIRVVFGETYCINTTSGDKSPFDLWILKYNEVNTKTFINSNSVALHARK